MAPEFGLSSLQERALAAGLGLVALYGYLAVDLSSVVWSPVATALVSVPVTLCLFAAFGGSGRRWVGIGVGTAVGLAFGEYLALTGGG